MINNESQTMPDVEDVNYFDQVSPGRLRSRYVYTLRLFKNPNIAVGTFMITVLTFLAVFGSFISPFEPNKMNMRNRLNPPNLTYLCGTDNLGRDLFSRILHGTRLTYLIGLSAVALGLTIGVLLGLVAGYSRGMLQNILMRIVDIMYSFPALLIALSLVAFLGPSTTNLIIAIGFSSVPYYARVTHGVVLVERNKPYLDAAEIVGASPLRQIFRHLIPNIIPPLIVVSTLGFSSAVLHAAGLSFLGLGVQPPTPEWGLMLSSARNYFLRAPWLLIFPGIAIMITVLSFNIFGDGLRDILDPKLKSKI